MPAVRAARQKAPPVLAADNEGSFLQARHGAGETINISRTQVLFNVQAPLPPGKRMELSISWPVRLDGKCGLKLVACGRIVGCEGTSVALRIEKYEFRTTGRSLSVRAGI